MAYIYENWDQQTFLPPTIQEYIGPNDPVRVYDAFIDALNLNELGIIVNGEKAGAKEYHPKVLLKILIYGYSYEVRSSRKLERACHHNLSFIWLSGDLKPDYRTISRFFRKNKKAIKKVLSQTAKLCMKLGLIEGNSLFVNGSKCRVFNIVKLFQSSQNDDNNWDTRINITVKGKSKLIKNNKGGTDFRIRWYIVIKKSFNPEIKS